MDLNIEPIEEPKVKRNRNLSQAAKIRKSLREGKTVDQIIAELNISRQLVYSERWKMKARKRKSTKRTIGRPRKLPILRDSEVQLAQKLNIPLELYAHERAKLEAEEERINALQLELEDARHQHHNWGAIVSYLETRLADLRKINP